MDEAVSSLCHKQRQCNVKSIIWVITLNTILGALIYQLLSTSIAFIGEPITTYAFARKPTNFPTISLCPMHLKYELSKLQKYEILTEKINYYGVYDRINYHTSHEVFSYPKMLARQYEIDEEERSEIAIRAGLSYTYSKTSESLGMSYPELELSLSADFDEIIGEVKGSMIVNKRKEVASSSGVCYSFDVRLDHNAILASDLKFQFLIKRDVGFLYYDRGAPSTFFSYNADFLFFGAPVLFNTYYALPQCKETKTRFWGAWRNVETEIHFSSATFLRQNLRRQPCKHWSDREREICVLECYNREYCSKGSPPCVIPHANQTTAQQFGMLCSWLTGPVMIYEGETDHCFSKKEMILGQTRDLVDYCTEQCPRLCNQVVNYVTHTYDKFYHMGVTNQYYFLNETNFWANITLRYQNPFAQFVMEEKREMLGIGYFSEIGSAVSLYLGLSVVGIAGMVKDLIIACKR